MLRKLRSRLIISHTLPIIILTPIIGLVFLYLLETHYSLGSVADNLIDQGTLIGEFTQDDTTTWTDPDTASQTIERLKSRVSARVMLLDRSGRLLSSSLSTDSARVGQVMDYPVVQQALLGQTGWQVDYSPFMRTRIIDMGMPAWDDAGTVIGVVRLSYDITPIEQKTIPLRWLVVITIVVGTTIALLLGLLLARSLTAPLSRLSRAVQELRPDSTPTLLPETGLDEVKSVALSYNQMAHRLYNMETSRRQLLANVVHELGTPLGAIKAAAQALENGAVSDPQLASELATGIGSQVDQLRLLVDDLTLLGETELRELRLVRQWVNLGDLIQVQCQSYAYLVRQKHIELTCHVTCDLPPIAVDANRVCQILANLLHNAYKFTPPRGRIVVSAGLEYSDGIPTYVQLQVSDSGPGVELAEQEKIFELLYRNAQQRNLYKGMGIGLALSRRLAEAHGGSLSVDSHPGQGATFTLRLPVAATDPQAKPNLDSGSCPGQ
jgi:two-component system sensor histidine kinase BaeS